MPVDASSLAACLSLAEVMTVVHIDAPVSCGFSPYIPDADNTWGLAVLGI